ncbi:MAG: hypothetical protein Q9159_005181 [Coniocarpon cinnabarinum]
MLPIPLRGWRLCGLLLLTPDLVSSENQKREIQVPKAGTQDARVLRPDLFGYSLEPSAVSPYVSSQVARNLLQLVTDRIGKAPPIRVGGTTADEITVVPHVNSTSGYLSSVSGSAGGNTGAEEIELDARWYDTWNDYFPNGTDFIYTLNFRNETDDWATAISEAEDVIAALQQKLIHFEFGNEVDHYISKNWRGDDWDVVEYTAQWRALRTEIQALEAYQALSPPPLFQAAVFADPPFVPDQQDEADDFGIVNLTTRAGLTNNDGTISSYAVHLYPQSNCDPERQARLSLDLLSNHSVLYQNVSQYIPSQEAAIAAGAPLVMGETNSVSCGGKSGVSDTFGAALWSVDYTMLAASLGLEQIFFHLGDQSQYSAFTPLPYMLMNESLQAGIRPPFYSHLFVAEVLAGLGEKNLTVEALPSANLSDFSGYAIRANDELEKIVLLDMGVWNSSQGVSNPSTLSATDSTAVSPGQRPVSSLLIDTEWTEGTTLEALRMQAPGTNAKSDVSLSGLTVDPATGGFQGCIESERLVMDLKRVRTYGCVMEAEK